MTQQKTSFKLPLLGGALALQVVVAALLFWQSNQQTQITIEPLLTVNNESVNQLTIAGSEGSVSLHKQGEQWFTEDNLPAETSRVNSLVEKLTALKTGWPLATSETAQQRFEVADEKFSRKVELSANDTPASTVYLGSSVSFKKVHVRKADDDKIYAGDVNVYDAATNVNAWLDTALLRPSGDILAVQQGQFKVAKSDGEWPHAQPQSDEVVEQEVAETSVESEEENTVEVAQPEEQKSSFDAAAFAAALENLQVMGVAENLAELDAPDAKNNEDVKNAIHKIEFSVTTSTGEVHYELLSKNNQFYIRNNQYNALFKLAKTQFDNLALIAQQHV